MCVQEPKSRRTDCRMANGKTMAMRKCLTQVKLSNTHRSFLLLAMAQAVVLCSERCIQRDTSNFQFILIRSMDVVVRRSEKSKRTRNIYNFNAIKNNKMFLWFCRNDEVTILQFSSHLGNGNSKDDSIYDTWVCVHFGWSFLLSLLTLSHSHGWMSLHIASTNIRKFQICWVYWLEFRLTLLLTTEFHANSWATSRVTMNNSVLQFMLFVLSSVHLMFGLWFQYHCNGFCPKRCNILSANRIASFLELECDFWNLREQNYGIVYRPIGFDQFSLFVANNLYSNR